MLRQIIPALACLLMGQVGLAHAQLRAPAAGGAASADTIAVDEDAEDADLGLTARPPAAGGDMPVAPAPTPRVIAADAPAVDRRRFRRPAAGFSRFRGRMARLGSEHDRVPGQAPTECA